MTDELDIKCYRVWFRDGSALLVDALSAAEAKDLGAELARKQSKGVDWQSLALKVQWVECLDEAAR